MAYLVWVECVVCTVRCLFVFILFCYQFGE